MDALTSDRVRAAFARIEEAPAAARAALIAALDGDIRAEVQSLLQALDEAGGFLSRPDGAAPHVGSLVGPYALVEEIGRGGMGVVYRAARRDGEYDQDVAIKIATGHFPGPEAEHRFIRERQILARLDHPHIVRLLDGGLAHGYRYFVMELVAGSPITESSAPRPLDDRLRLFGDVCSAVHYAHQQLILHRDLKPANIVVTADGLVKVLDFGIARILREDTDASSGATTMAHPLSYGCASPEQLRGEPLSLASDIYALGVLLYELATGVNPQYQPGATFEETFRRVVDETPPAPSRVAHTLPRDLDAIVMKAIAKTPAERYPSVAELHADIERLRTGRPVLARTPSAAYVFSRFVRRNRALSAVAALLILASAAGVSTYLYQARIARRAEAVARQEAATSEQVSTFLTRLFGASDPNAQATTTLRDLLDRAAARIEPDLKDQPKAQVHLLATLGHVYGSLGVHKEAVALSEKAIAIEGGLGAPTLETAEASLTLGRSIWQLGDLERARQAFERALEVRTQLGGGDTIEAAAILNNIGGLEGQLEHYPEAIAAHTRALEMQRRLRGADSPHAANSLRGLAIIHARQKNHEESMRLNLEVLAIFEKAYPAGHANIALGHESVAVDFLELKRFAEARQHAERTLEIRRRVLGPNHPQLAFTLSTMGAVLIGEGRAAESEQMHQEALRIREAALGKEAPRVADSLYEIGKIKVTLGQRAAARPLFERALQIYQKAYGPEHTRTKNAARALAGLAAS
jgi:tetratricopeptide (TPR) repeat protein